ncbi:MAG: NTP transferase domain-containing protein [Fimbriimonas ginsengisoli]|uniref:NTP transferase domain-containing protein n=1 Tax=Fimbriimonas ginsengisoli TaxID=1005039 RepID=A0A931LSZ3_FIMGI|nr:NTP transferase domain-containing protein [Fimbriimonas ginsengisoli]MBI3721940.1 NTP transferase domain-containing protein [Fimbriimonas ginsengisoli]
MGTYDAILPAGATLDEEFAREAGVTSKALIEIGGQTVLERTLRALQASGVVGRTVVIGAEDVRSHPAAGLATVTVEPGNSGPENIYRGLSALASQGDAPKRVLVVTTDLPFLKPEMIREFVERCPEDGHFCVPLVAQAAFHERFPGTSATFVALKDGVWTTGCVYLIDAEALRLARPHIERVFENRKSKFGMARLLGPVFVFKWLTKSLTVTDVEAKIKSLLGCTGRAIADSPPEFSFDIDYPEDYRYAMANARRFATAGPAEGVKV